MDVTCNTDKERWFELHVTVREHIPPRQMTGMWAGGDVSDVYSAIAVQSDGIVDVLTLREMRTIRYIVKLYNRMSRCKKNS